MFFPAKKITSFARFSGHGMKQTPLQSSPVDCQAYSAHDNRFIQIGPSMCSISELMGGKKQQNNNQQQQIIPRKLIQQS